MKTTADADTNTDDTSKEAQAPCNALNKKQGELSPALSIPQQRFIPVTKWNQHFDWPPPGGLRHLRFHCETNGFKKAFVCVGGRVLVDAQVFWCIVEGKGSAAA